MDTFHYLSVVSDFVNEVLIQLNYYLQSIGAEVVDPSQQEVCPLGEMSLMLRQMVAMMREMMLMNRGAVVGSVADLQLCKTDDSCTHTLSIGSVCACYLLSVHIIYYDAYCVQNPAVFVRAAFWEEVGL